MMRALRLIQGALVVVVCACVVLTAQTPGQTVGDRAWPTSRPPRPLSARDVVFPPYEIRTLPNGLRVVAVLQDEQPVVSLRLIVGAGAAQDPTGRPGVAALSAALLDQGTLTRSAEDIADTIDYVGGGLGTGAGTDLSFVNVLVMKGSFDLALDLLSDVVRNPAFLPEEVERQRQQMLSGLTVSAQDPDYVARVVADRLVFGFHPYGLPGSGTPESIAAITRDDLVRFHEAWFAPNNAILAIVGDVTTEEAFRGAERALGLWQPKDLPLQAFSELPEPTRRLVIIDRPGAVQTEIRIAQLGIPRRHDDYQVLDLATKILGGEGANRLQRVLRSERSLTYGASADMVSLRQGGAIIAETDTRTEATGEALRVAVEEFWRLQRDRVHEGELADAKAYLTGSFPMSIETPDAIAAQVLNAIFYDRDVAEIETYRERITAIGPDDIARVARAYLRPGRLSIVLVGDARAIAPQLRSVGFDEYEVIPIDALDLSRADLRRP